MKMANEKNKLEKRIFILDSKALPLITEGVKNKLKEFAKKEGINLYIEFTKRIENLPEDYDAYAIHPSDIRNLEDLKRIKQDNPKCKIYMISKQMPQVPDNLRLYVDRFISPLDFYNPEDFFDYRKQIVLSLKENEPK